MGQATVDLPDPLDVPPAASLSGTDDLLAQLAGDEIDRLLAEANEEAAHPPGEAAPVVADAAVTPSAPATATGAPSAGVTPNAPATATGAPSAGVPDGTASAPAVTAGAPAAPTAPGTPAAVATGAAPTDSSAQTPAATPSSDAAASAISSEVKVDDDLDALLSELTLEKPPAPAAAAPGAIADVAGAVTELAGDTKSLTERVPEVLAEHGAAPVPAGADAAGTPAQVPNAVTAAAPDTGAASPDMLMSAAERDALSLSDLAAEADAAAEQDAADAAGRAAEDRLAPAIKLLELINAPLSFIPDAFRDALGKVAILTLVNAIAVLIYVLFVRH